jgi:hypothetical protein
MRVALIVCLVAAVSACRGISGEASAVSVGAAATNIAGTWNGTIASSNNATEQFRMVLAHSGSEVSGSWDSSSVSWTRQTSGVASGSSFDGQLRLSGTAADGTVCTGTANWTSASGAGGGSCPAPLPTALKINV